MSTVVPVARGAGRRAGHDAVHVIGQQLAGDGPDLERRPGVVGDDVGRHAAVQDDAVHPGDLGQELAERVDRHEQLDHRGQRAAALGRAARGVRRDAVELERQRHRRQGVPDRDGAVTGVEHQGRVHVVEHAGLQLDDLAPGALLAGRADHPQRAGRLRQGLQQRGGRADPAGGDEVVPAAVADAGQRVVLQQVGDDRRAVAVLRHERGVQPGDGGLHGEAAAGQPVLQQARRAVLGQRQLGMTVQVEAERAERLVEAGDGGVDGVVNCVQVRGCGPRLGGGHGRPSFLSGVLGVTSLARASARPRRSRAGPAARSRR
jgi:hypothetical protein